MKRISTKVSGVSLAATLTGMLLATFGSRAAAEQIMISPFIGDTVLAAEPLADQPVDTGDMRVAPPAAIPASSLEQLVTTRVDGRQAADELTDELKCLAGAIYFESRSESLEGQLAVGRVIVARTRSGRFPASYCGVVYQPAQFSFIHRQTMPSVDAQSPLWQRAVAMARIADANSWQNSAEGALFFHAARVATNWRVKRVAQIDHHIFYR